MAIPTLVRLEDLRALLQESEDRVVSRVTAQFQLQLQQFPQDLVAAFAPALPEDLKLKFGVALEQAVSQSGADLLGLC
jgi:hypothetical protein